MKYFIQIIALTFGFSPIYAQFDFFKPATLIQKNGDTLAGFIERTDEVVMSRGISFAKEMTANSAIQKFTASEIKGFYFQDPITHFESVDYKRKKETSATQRFAKVLLRGECSLFKLNLDNGDKTIVLERDKQHVYIVKKKDKSYLLDYIEKQEGVTLSVSKPYLNMLQLLLNDCANAKKLIPQTEFTDRAILNILKTYNTCSSTFTKQVEFTYTPQKIFTQGIEVALCNLYRESFVTGKGGLSLGFFRNVKQSDQSKRLSWIYGINLTLLNYKSGKNPNSFTIFALKAPLLGHWILNKKPFTPYFQFGLVGQISKDAGTNLTYILPYPAMGFGFQTPTYRAGLLIEKTDMFFDRFYSVLSLRAAYFLQTSVKN
jgi:hypothetical protein